MNIAQLEEGNKLLEIINVTRKQLENLKLLEEERYSKQIASEYDGLYNFTISEHRDGSGKSAQLYRERGNAELLDVIIATLEKQLKEFEEEFELL